MSNLAVVLLIFLVLLLAGVLPVWPYSHAWGPVPGGIITIILVVLIVLLITGRL